MALVERQPPRAVDPVQARVDVTAVAPAAVRPIDIRTGEIWTRGGDRDRQTARRVRISKRASDLGSLAARYSLRPIRFRRSGWLADVQGGNEDRRQQRDHHHPRNNRPSRVGHPAARESLARQAAATARRSRYGDRDHGYLDRPSRALARLLACHHQQYRAVSTPSRRPLASAFELTPLRRGARARARPDPRGTRFRCARATRRTDRSGSLRRCCRHSRRGA